MTTLEQLLHEFHYSETGNIRKREIETQLIEQQNNPNAWHESLYHLPNNSNQYLWFFNVSTIESTITRRWTSLSDTDRDRIRESVWQNYTTLGSVSKMQRDKVGQLIALMGKREFPTSHSTYMNHIIELLSKNFLLGITLLRATSDELCSTKEDIPTEQKSKFHAAVADSMNEVMDLLCRYLTLFVNWVSYFAIGRKPEEYPYPELLSAIPHEDTQLL